MHHRSAFLGGQTTGNGTAKKHQRSPQRSNRVPHRGRLQKQISYDRLPAPKPVRPSSSDFGMGPPATTTTTTVTAVSLAAAASAGGITTPQQQKSSVNVVSAFGGTMSPPHQFARKVQPPSRRVDDDNDWNMSPLPSLKHTESGDGTPQEVANGEVYEDDSFMGGTPSFHGGEAVVQPTPRVQFTEAYAPEQFQLHRIDSTRSMMSGSTVGSASVRSTGRGGGRGGRFLARHNSGASVMSRVSAVSAASVASSAASELNYYMGGNSSTTSFSSDYSSINSSRPSYQPTSSMYSTNFARSGNSPGRTFGSASAKSRRGMASDSSEPCRPWNPMYHNLLHDRDA